MWTRTYLVLLLVRVYFATSPSYIHPDEDFQGPEVIAGESFPSLLLRLKKRRSSSLQDHQKNSAKNSAPAPIPLKLLSIFNSHRFIPLILHMQGELSISRTVRHGNFPLPTQSAAALHYGRFIPYPCLS